MKFRRAASTYHLWNKGTKPLVPLNKLSKQKEFCKTVLDGLAKYAAARIPYPFVGKVPSSNPSVIIYAWRRFEDEPSNYFPLTLEYNVDKDIVSICGQETNEEEFEEFLMGKIL